MCVISECQKLHSTAEYAFKNIPWNLHMENSQKLDKMSGNKIMQSIVLMQTITIATLFTAITRLLPPIT